MANMIDYKYIHKAGLSIGIAYKLQLLKREIKKMPLVFANGIFFK